MQINKDVYSLIWLGISDENYANMITVHKIIVCLVQFLLQGQSLGIYFHCLSY